MSVGAQIGDSVRVHWIRGGTIDGIVEYIPCAVGDSWVIWTPDGEILHAQNFEFIEVINRKAFSTSGDVGEKPVQYKVITPAASGEKEGG